MSRFAAALKTDRTRIDMTGLFKLAAALLCLSALECGAQVAPSVDTMAPGFNLPQVGGTLQYGATVSENVSTGFYGDGGATASTNLSGDLAYLSVSKIHPFSVIYTGALFSGGGGQPLTFVQDLALSQVFLLRSWDLTVSDQVSYLPQSPTTGLSGVPGLGDTGADPVQVGPVTGQGVLTNYANRVTNSTVGSASRRLTSNLSLAGTASYAILRFTDSSQSFGLLDSNQTLATVGANYTLGARSSVNSNYTFSHIGYTSGTAFSFDVQGLNVGYARQVSRWLSLNASLGPQWTASTAAGLANRTNVNLATDVAAAFKTRSVDAAVTYVRGTNNGFGVYEGGFSDSINSTARHTFGRVWGAGAQVNYTRTSSLSALGLPPFSARTFVAGLQGTRGLTRTVSMYLSYNTQHQSTEGENLANSAFRGFSQTAGFGITYAPRSLSLGPK